MAACENIDITQDQSNEILQTIYVMISTNTPPYTIVDYVCAAVDIPMDGVPSPEISATNWCLLTCISSCLYGTSVFTPPSSYAYLNKAQTYTCVTCCFPQFPLESTSSGGGAPPPDLAKNLDAWSAEQEGNVKDELKSGIAWLMDILKRAFENMAITAGSYAIWIAMLAEHLTEITMANITKKIGEAIKAIAKAWKAAKDMGSAAIAQAKAALAFQTDPNFVGPPEHYHGTLRHLSHAVSHAMTTVGGYITDMMDNIGKYMEQIGQFLHDSADKLYDMKEIAFAVLALGAMMKEIMDLIKWTYARIKQIIKSAESVIFNIKDKYKDQAKNKVKEKVNVEKINSMIEPTSNNKSSPLKDKAASLISSKINASKFSKAGVSIT